MSSAEKFIGFPELQALAKKRMAELGLVLNDYGEVMEIAADFFESLKFCENEFEEPEARYQFQREAIQMFRERFCKSVCGSKVRELVEEAAVREGGEE